MLKGLVRVANKLDEVGLTKEADKIDALMQRIPSEELFDEEEDMPVENEESVDHLVTYSDLDPDTDSELSDMPE